MKTEKFQPDRAWESSQALLALVPGLDPHFDHFWRQIGRCVYCSCGNRLYQGTLPKPSITIEVVDE